MTIAIIVLLALILFILVAILDTLKKRPVPQKAEFPKIEIPKIEIPKIEIPPQPASEVNLDLSPVIEAIKNISIPVPQKAELPKTEFPKIEIEEFAKILRENSALMRVNQAEFQSGLEAFHKAIDKLLTQIPSVDKELNAQKEFMQKFEEAMRSSQEAAAEAMNENSLRLQEILAEVLNKEAK